MRDLVIAGGGPVGLATATYAARLGLDVVVREPRTGTIDKACGEGLMPGAVSALRDLGIEPAGRELVGIRYVHEGRQAQAAFGHGSGLGVRRTTLHAALAQGAADAGVRVEHRAVDGVVQHDDHVVVDGDPARWLIAADGLHSPLRRHLGLDAPVPSRRFGMRAHLHTAPWTPYVEVHWAPHAEAYLTPVADDLVGVAVLTSSPAALPELLDGFPGLAERLAGHEITKPRGAGPLRQRSRARTAGRVLLVGDAAGYVDALTGEGIAVGLAQGRAAVDAAIAGRPARYERAWRRLTWKHDLLTGSLLAATRRPMLRERLVPAAAAAPWLFTAAVDALASPA